MLHYSVKSSALFLRSVYSLVSWLDFDTERRIRALIQINSSARKEALESGLGRISRSRRTLFRGAKFCWNALHSISWSLASSNIHERTSRTSISDALRTHPSLRSFPPIRAGSLTSAPFCITVHRPGRLPIMSLYSPKDAVYRNHTLDPSLYDFSNHVARSRPYGSVCV